MHLNGSYDTLSNSELDSLYASTYASFNGSTGATKVSWAQALQLIAIDIVDRTANVGGFIEGIFGISKFPQYDAIQKTNPDIMSYSQVNNAQTAVATSAANVASNVSNAVKIGLVGTAVVAVGLIALYIYVNRRK